MQPANRHLLQWIQRELAGKLTEWLSGGRRDGTCKAEQLNFRAAYLRAAQAARPLEPVLGGEPKENQPLVCFLTAATFLSESHDNYHQWNQNDHLLDTIPLCAGQF